MSIDFGDVDGDGDFDVVAPLGSFVSVSLNDGEGQFALPTLYPVGLAPSQAVLADLDGDGDLDIAVTIDDDDSVETLFNDGTGVFTTGAIYPVGPRPRSVVAGDLDGDGDTDLVTLSPQSFSLSFVLNLGDGTFADEVRVGLPGASQRLSSFPGPFMTLVDLERDGDLDVAVPAPNRLVLVLNDGSGGFVVSGHAPRSSDTQVHAVGAADLDGDGDADLVASITGAPQIMGVWLNNSDGTFPDATVYDAPIIGGGSMDLSIGDLDRDGDPDVALGHHTLGRHFIARNNGDGSFATPEDILVKAPPLIVQWADINGDGWLDLGTIAWGAGPAAYLARLNDGAGNLFQVRSVEEDFPNSGYSAADAADLDGDGNLDLVVASAENDPFDFRVLRGDGTGAFVERYRDEIPIATPAQVEAVFLSDMNGDGLLDLVFSVDEDGTQGFDPPGSVWIALAVGEFAFGEPVRHETPDGEPWGMDIADLDRDGDPDLLVRVRQLPDEDDPTRPLESRVVVFTNDGSGRLKISQTIVLFSDRSGIGADVLTGDIDGDGDIDAVASPGSSNRLELPVSVLTNDGSGALSLTHQITVSPDARALATGDWDGDGDLDAAVMHRDSDEDPRYLTILDNDGAGNLSVSQIYADADIEMAGTMRSGDVNGDGWPDLVLGASFIGVVVHLNDRRGGFADSAWYATNAPTGEALIGDFDSDGDADILSVSRSQGGLGPIVLLENVACCGADLDGDGTLNPDDFFIFLERFAQGRGDVDRDGDFDSDDFFAYLELFAAGCGG